MSVEGGSISGWGLGSGICVAAGMGPTIGAVANEGPVTSLEGFVPMGRNDINTLDLDGGTNKQNLRSVDLQPDFSLAGEIIFQTQPVITESAESLNAADALIEVRSILNQVKVEYSKEQLSPLEEKKAAEPEIIQEAAYWFVDVPAEERLVKPAEVVILTTQAEPLIMPLPMPNILEYPGTRSVASPSGEPAPLVQEKTEVFGLTEPTPVIAPQPVLQLEYEETEIVTERKLQKKGEDNLEAEEIQETKLYLEDHEVSTVRRGEIREAVAKARAEAGRLGLKKIAGWLVAKFLPPEHEGNRSQVVKKTGPDGSYGETVEAIAGAGKFASEQQALERSNKIIAEKKPVKLGKEGTPVAGQDVARVFKYRMVKPVAAYTEVIKRMVKREPTSKDLELEGIFPKAA